MELDEKRAELVERGLLEPIEGILLECHTTFAEAFGPGRFKHQVNARREIARYLKGLGWSLVPIAHLLNLKHHASVVEYLGGRRGK